MGKTFEFDAHVLTVGTWKGDPFTLADLEDMAANFTALSAEIKPPVKLGHNPKLRNDGKDGLPALGWVKSLKRVGDDLIATLTDVPEIVYKAIKAGLYRRVSSEVYFGYKGKTTGKTHKRVFGGVALLGADIPAVSTLADLTAYLSQATADVNADSFDKVVVFSSSQVAAEKIILKDEVTDMTEQEIKDLKDRAETAEAKAKEYKTDAEAKDTELVKIKEAEAKRAETTAFDGFKAFCDDLVTKGKMAPAGRDALTAEGAKMYSEDKVVITLEAFKAFSEHLGQTLDAGEHGLKDGDKKHKDADSALDAACKKYMAANKCSYTEAMDAMPDVEPAIYTAAVDSTGARKDGE